MFLDVSAALDSRLNGMTDLPPVAWPNVAYEPTIGTLWLRPTLLPADTVAATLGSTGTDENLGVYQVSVFAPSGTGKGAAVVMADAIAERFKPMTKLTYNGLLVRCVTASIGSAVQNGDWYHVPVYINYLSHTTKR